ncbi:hypothetical protein NDU88_011132 [Pleurodeles waltl]|uniref:Uncharacterized protein n=1 Tax=Pleurodeles waltl TaxID=8319 RepID=A0AAV7R287_PLEWA|nr:hypothetical protein NDU88_011132 [Pleurodeles waltl]
MQEVTVVGCRLEGMDTKISDLAAETKFIHTNIAGFQDRVERLEYRLTAVEDHLNTVLDRDQELSHRLSQRPSPLTCLTCLFPSTGAPTAPRLGSVHQAALERPQPIIACFLNQEPVWQLLAVAHIHSPYDYEGHTICIAIKFLTGDQ